MLFTRFSSPQRMRTYFFTLSSDALEDDELLKCDMMRGIKLHSCDDSAAQAKRMQDILRK